MWSESKVEGEVIVGKVTRAHGMWGEVVVNVTSDFPGRFDSGEFLFILDLPRRIQRSYRPRPHIVVLKLEGISSREAAVRLKGANITISQEVAPNLPEGSYYHFQLLGMEVCTSEGQLLGHITNIFPTGSNDVYVVTLDGSETLIPAIDDVIQDVDVDMARMTVVLPEGLL
jgi:16S rRNA processing protein RimM